MVDGSIASGEQALAGLPKTDQDAPPTLRELVRWHADVLRGIPRESRIVRPRRRQQQLIESLSEVAEAISSTKSTSSVLCTVVEEAKSLVGTDKAVLCLLSGSGDDIRIDDSAVFVRGRRDQYPEHWWRAKIAEVATSALEQRVPVVALVDDTWLMTVPVKAKGRPIGVLAVMNRPSRRFRDEQVALLAVLGAFAGTAIENARLHSQSQYALLADERNRIAKEMHDGLSQSLFGTSLELDVCRKRVRDHPDEVAQRLDHVQTILVRSLSELRRYIHDLRPLTLNTLGLVGALHQRIAEIGDPQGLSIRVYTDGDERPLPPGPEACLYRVAQEAVSNITKHACARHAVVMLTFSHAEVRLLVEDDGHGFDINEALQRVENDSCIGLKSMRERVQSEGGRFSISSGARGTTLQVVLPC
jgi:signal transduction histidine kinase